MEKREIAFSPPDITDAEIKEVIEALKSGWITTGIRTKTFEKDIAEYCGTSKAVCLSSATSAMEMTLRILGIGAGDEVITTAYTYTASAAVINHVGAKIVLVDTKPDSFEIDYDALSEAVTARTKAVIPVDLGGRLCDYELIMKILEDKKELYRPNTELQKKFERIIVISDCAHGFGAQKKIGNEWRKAGTFADFTCFSFHAVKNLTTGEGGAVVWKDRQDIDNEELYKKYMLISLHGQSKDAFQKTKLGAWEYDILNTAYKCNMTDVQAAIGLKQLERYDQILRRRHFIIERYNQLSESMGCSQLVHCDKNNISSGHLYLLRIPNIGEIQRNTIIVKLAEQGVATNVHYKPLPMMTAYKKLGFDITNYPNAYNQYKNELTLPLHTNLTDEDIVYIEKVLPKCVESYAKGCE